jgi:hypothetical protein
MTSWLGLKICTPQIALPVDTVLSALYRLSAKFVAILGQIYSPLNLSLSLSLSHTHTHTLTLTVMHAHIENERWKHIWFLHKHRTFLSLFRLFITCDGDHLWIMIFPGPDKFFFLNAFFQRKSTLDGTRGKVFYPLFQILILFLCKHILPSSSSSSSSYLFHYK